jgi:hypothetical protein
LKFAADENLNNQKTLSIGAAIIELSIVIELMSQEDWTNRLQYLPI